MSGINASATAFVESAVPFSSITYSHGSSSLSYGESAGRRQPSIIWRSWCYMQQVCIPSSWFSFFGPFGPFGPSYLRKKNISGTTMHRCILTLAPSSMRLSPSLCINIIYHSCYTCYSVEYHVIKYFIHLYIILYIYNIVAWPLNR